MHFGAIFLDMIIQADNILLPASGQASQVIRGLLNSLFVSIISTIIT